MKGVEESVEESRFRLVLAVVAWPRAHALKIPLRPVDNHRNCLPAPLNRA